MSPRRLAFAVALLAPATAAAHINVTSPTPRTSELKQRHCGQTGGARANIHTAPPGSTLHVVWDEYIQHPGYFRISFNQNGDTFRIPPAPTPGAFPTEDLSGQMDPDGSGSLIIADQILDGTVEYDVQLPNVECNNCTLQVIQVVTDKPPYTTDTASNDIYFACVDLVLSATAPDAAPATPDADPGNPGNPDAGGGGGGASGGCSTSGGSAGLASGILTAVALVLARRRHRRSA